MRVVKDRLYRVYKAFGGLKGILAIFVLLALLVMVIIITKNPTGFPHPSKEERARVVETYTNTTHVQLEEAFTDYGRLIQKSKDISAEYNEEKISKEEAVKQLEEVDNDLVALQRFIVKIKYPRGFTYQEADYLENMKESLYESIAVWAGFNKEIVNSIHAEDITLDKAQELEKAITSAEDLIYSALQFKIEIEKSIGVIRPEESTTTVAEEAVTTATEALTNE